ncbi:MAG: cryptochrome/photolyase family protein, partial [Verrucomicrobiae bacterium]|nr:cryptochrome/photolyase family protein [Verrucomicrobiae bacterium]
MNSGEITLIFPHQLFDAHPALSPGRPVALIEDALFFGDDRHWPLRFHRQKIALHRASLAAYAERLKSAGHQVSLLEHRRGSMTGESLTSLWNQGARHFFLADPVDDVLSRRLRRFAEPRQCRITISESPGFLSPREFLEEHFGEGRKPYMARFYEAQRRRLGVLMESDGRPVGGRWSFDTENRKKLPKGIRVPLDPACPPHRWTTAACEFVSRDYSDCPGSLEDFGYPVTHEDAESWLDDFLMERLGQFGDYEDAISSRHRVVFHSVLTPMLNLGLLTPRQVV